MRAFFVLPVAAIVPFAIFAAMQSVTGDPLSAVVLGLLLLISVGAWFAAPIAASGPTPGRNRAIP